MRIDTGRDVATSATPRPEGPPASRVDQPPTGLRLWLLAIRPRTLTIAVAPVLAGVALAWSEARSFDALALAATLLGALAIQAGTNLWNDVGDALRGGDQPLRQGPPRVTALGWASPDRVRAAALTAFAVAVAAGLYLAWLGGWPIVALGLASLLAGWSYSGGPWPIAYSALGEVFVIAFFGIGAVAGTAWLQAGAVGPGALVLGLAIGLPAAAVLMANNYRDMAADRLAGRRTLAIRLGIPGSKVAYAAMMLAPFPVLLGPGAPDGGWVTLAAAPEAVRLILAFASQPRGPAFNRILAHTARYQLLLAALFAAGTML